MPLFDSIPRREWERVGHNLSCIREGGRIIALVCILRQFMYLLYWLIIQYRTAVDNKGLSVSMCEHLRYEDTTLVCYLSTFIESFKQSIVCTEIGCSRHGKRLKPSNENTFKGSFDRKIFPLDFNEICDFRGPSVRYNILNVYSFYVGISIWMKSSIVLIKFSL